MCVVALLRQRDTEGTGIDRELSNKTVMALFRLNGGVLEVLAGTDQLIQSGCTICDLTDHPGLQYVAELLQMSIGKQVEKGGIGGPAFEAQPQSLVQQRVVPFGEGVQMPRAAAAAQYAEYSHQQQIPLRVTNPETVAAIRDGLEEANQIDIGAEINGRRGGLVHREQAGHASKPGISKAAKS
jgi:hypothetical protein